MLIRVEEGGDGTLPYHSSLPGGFRPIPLPQQHGSLAASREAISAVVAVIAGRDPHDERLGTGEVGFALPDLVPVGPEVTVAVSGVTGPTAAQVIVRDEDNVTIDEPVLHFARGRWWFTTAFRRARIFRVTVADGGTSPVVQYTLAHDS